MIKLRNTLSIAYSEGLHEFNSIHGFLDSKYSSFLKSIAIHYFDSYTKLCKPDYLVIGSNPAINLLLLNRINKSGKTAIFAPLTLNDKWFYNLYMDSIMKRSFEKELGMSIDKCDSSDQYFDTAYHNFFKFNTIDNIHYIDLFKLGMRHIGGDNIKFVLEDRYIAEDCYFNSKPLHINNNLRKYFINNLSKLNIPTHDNVLKKTMSLLPVIGNYSSYGLVISPVNCILSSDNCFMESSPKEFYEEYSISHRQKVVPMGTAREICKRPSDFRTSLDKDIELIKNLT
jgi:hypothetical protein